MHQPIVPGSFDWVGIARLIVTRLALWMLLALVVVRFVVAGGRAGDWSDEGRSGRSSLPARIRSAFAFADAMLAGGNAAPIMAARGRRAVAADRIGGRRQATGDIPTSPRRIVGARDDLGKRGKGI